MTEPAPSPISPLPTPVQIAELAKEIASTEVYGDSMTNLQYVLIRGANAIGLPQAYAKDMLEQLAKCQIEECYKWREVAMSQKTDQWELSRVTRTEMNRKDAGIATLTAERDDARRALDRAEELGRAADDTANERIAELAAERDEARERAEKAERAQSHTQQWYAERLEPIKDVAKRVGVWDEVAAIIANGSGTRQTADGYVYEPPTYAQQLNTARHRATAAESARDAALAEVAGLREGRNRAFEECAEYIEGALNVETGRAIAALFRARKACTALAPKGGPDGPDNH